MTEEKAREEVDEEFFGNRINIDGSRPNTYTLDTGDVCFVMDAIRELQSENKRMRKALEKIWASETGKGE